ncbi:hypothetical protein [Massilia sp.]|uniref:hypothetical protein n=1 Tax=Massilia sp. TaxID=1882437 RepID=UPI00391A23D5
MKPIPTETATDVGSVGKWLGAAAAGALLMYLLDPERGSTRRSRALSAVRAAGARTGATVDGVLHSAGDRLVGLKDSAASALSRGAGRVQAKAAPMLERARHGAFDATQRLEDSAERIRDRAKTANDFGSARPDASDSGRSPARHGNYGSYESAHEYGAESRARGGLSDWLRGSHGGGLRSSSEDYRSRDHDGAPHPALVGGGMLGLLSLMRRSPTGLLVGLAGLALLWQGTRDKTYRVSDNMPARLPQMKQQDEQGQAPMIPPAEQTGSRYLH